MKQEFEKYTAEDLKVWNKLFVRQLENMKDKASLDYQHALEEMREVINPHEMPNFEKINAWFKGRTGWEITCVPGLIEVDAFFELLAEKKFPSSTWLRSMDKLDYLEEPDMFHDIFGHVPLLSNPVYAQFVHHFGKLGQRFIGNPVKLKQLQRLYWFTIEFGLIQEDRLRIYGAGILSSFGETNMALDPSKIQHKSFDLNEILNMDFVTSEMQEKYYCLADFSQLEESIQLIENSWKKSEPEKIEL